MCFLSPFLILSLLSYPFVGLCNFEPRIWMLSPAVLHPGGEAVPPSVPAIQDFESLSLSSFLTLSK